MSGILIKSNFFTKVDYQKFIESTDLLKKRGPDESGYLFLENFSLGQRRLCVLDSENGKQPMSILNNHLIYNGQLYNREELTNDLIKNGYTVDSHSDTEILLKMIMLHKENCLNKLNGMFAFVYCNNHQIFAARDQIGAKPLYYTIVENDIIIASEIKAILNYTNKAIVDKNGLYELLGLGPSHSPGNTLYKGIYELKPGHYLTYDKDGLKITKYFDVVAKPYEKNLEDTISQIRFLVEDSCKRQISSDVELACFLSGGLDSSIVSSFVSDEKRNLSTYSLDYEGNNEEYKSNKYETSNDQDYIDYMVKSKSFNHTNCVLDTNTLVDYLKTAVILRDGPGMADVDASLFWLAKKIRGKHTVALSGEGADEIFGGYPWFYRNEEDNKSFPWIRNLDFRQSIINKNLNMDIKKFVDEKYNEIIDATPILSTDTEERIKERQMSYLNLKYFMTGLLDRKDRMTMGASLEVRMPFGDTRLVNFLYNVPFKYKYFNNTEKALLREACKDILPREIYSRTKSPYPKTRSKKYSSIIKKMLLDVLDDKNSILYTIFDENKLLEIINDEKELETPWYGQLMRKDQLLAYFYQIDYWFKEYNIELELD